MEKREKLRLIRVLDRAWIIVQSLCECINVSVHRCVFQCAYDTLQISPPTLLLVFDLSFQ